MAFMAKMVVMDQTTSFWLDLFTWETWNEFLNSGGKISGFRESRWPTEARSDARKATSSLRVRKLLNRRCASV